MLLSLVCLLKSSTRRTVHIACVNNCPTLLAPGVRSGRSHRRYFHWCVCSSHPPAGLVHIACVNNCRRYLHQEFAQAEAIDATFTGVFAQVIHLHQTVDVTQNNQNNSNWSLLRLKPHGRHIHRWGYLNQI